MGIPISATPSCAITEPSRYSTIEWMIDWGWTRTWTCSGVRSKSQRASMTSSPLFINVAESTVIFAPIFHVGCWRASSTLTRASSSFGIVRNGPPDAVSRMRWTSDRLCPSRHWKIALCSESTGSSGTLCSRAAAVMRLPAITSVSLLANAIVFPVLIAAMVGKSPAPPTIAESTRSAGTSAASVTSPSGPRRSSGSGRGNARATASTASGSWRARARGRWRAQSSAINSGEEPRAAMPSTWNSSGNRSTSSRARRPTDPVTPRMVSRFMRRGSFGSRNENPAVRGVVEQHGRIEQQAVDPVEHTAVARNQPTGVLRAGAPLQRGFDQIADLPDDPEHRAHRDRVLERKRPEEPRLPDHRSQDRDTELGDRALDGLVRADDRCQAVTSDSGSNEVGGRLSQPRHPDQQQHPFSSGWEVA